MLEVQSKLAIIQNVRKKLSQQKIDINDSSDSTAKKLLQNICQQIRWTLIFVLINKINNKLYKTKCEKNVMNDLPCSNISH